MSCYRAEWTKQTSIIESQSKPFKTESGKKVTSVSPCNSCSKACSLYKTVPNRILIVLFSSGTILRSSMESVRLCKLKRTALFVFWASLWHLIAIWAETYKHLPLELCIPATITHKGTASFKISLHTISVFIINITSNTYMYRL